MSYNALPSGYQWLEYISSTGTQYINTGVYRTTNTRILLEFEYTAAPSNDQASIGMMNVSGDNDGGFAIFIGSNGSFSQCIKRSSYSAPYPLTLNQKYKVDFNNDDKVYVNDTLVATFNNNPITTVTKGFPIFASMWDNYDLILYVSAKLYSYKMYESETLIRDFIPCKNSSNEIGLYDTVSNAFYANSGTGMFVAGPAATRTITYNMMGHGTQISPQTVAFGQAGTAPTSPIVEGYAFGGWYNESTCTTLYDWTSIVTEDKTLYAKWTAVVIVSAPVITSIDWTKSMQQTYEFYKVDPDTWQDSTKLDLIESCTINRDLESDTLGSATFECTGLIDECYIRIYMVATQRGVSHRFCLGTYLVQTPGTKFNGKRAAISMDGYTPLIELKNSYPSIGYTIRKYSEYSVPIMTQAAKLCRDHLRAPVVEVSVPTPVDERNKLYSHFMASPDDTWFSFIAGYISFAKYSLSLEADGRVIFEPARTLGSLQPVWTYTDDNSSILLPDISDDGDLYNVPNVVEVIYSTDSRTYMARVENNDINSPISIPNRGREIMYRDTNPDISGDMTGSEATSQTIIENYATELLKQLSTLEHTVTYSHGYCPVRIGDGVMLNYRAAGLYGVKAKVISQSFDCTTGCTVEETAMYTTSLSGEKLDVKHKIAYVSIYGSTPEPKIVREDYVLKSVDIPTLSATGHTFGGWYYDQAYTSAASAGNTITKNRVLYAKWT